MKTAAKVLFYIAILALACTMTGFTLISLERYFPSNPNPQIGFDGREIWGGPNEGVSLTAFGLLVFLISALASLVLLVLHRLKKPKPKFNHPK